MLLTEGEIFRSMEGNRELKNRSTPKTSDSFLTKVQKHFGGKIVFSTSDAGAIGHSLAKKMNRDLKFTPYTKINSMNHTFKYKTQQNR